MSKTRNAAAPTGGRERKGTRPDDRRRLDACLDEALAHTFPASDPFSVGQATGTEQPARPAGRNAPKRRRAPKR
jgi:hypothetical protein